MASPQPPTHLLEKERIPIFSFADAELGPIPSTFIRSVERISGQPRIKSLYLDYVDDNRPNHLFWQDALERLEINVNLNFEDGAYIPKKGPLLVIANHPFGVIDGLAICAEISKVRQDYKIITHQVLRQAPAVKHQILPINFEETAAALKTNMQTRKDAIKQIKDGGVLVLFPSGAISQSPMVLGPSSDPEWKSFAARLALIENTITVPIFFKGQNSFTYRLARRLSVTLGYSLMFREICRRIGSTIDVNVRKAVSADDLKHFGDRNSVTQYLRNITYGDDA
jgi:putative hemolysin